MVQTRRTRSSRGAEAPNNATDGNDPAPVPPPKKAKVDPAAPDADGYLHAPFLLDGLEPGTFYSIQEVVTHCNTKYATTGHAEWTCVNATPDAPQYPGQCWTLQCRRADTQAGAGPRKLHLYFFHGGLEPYQPHICHDKLIVCPFRPPIVAQETETEGAPVCAVFMADLNAEVDGDKTYAFLGQMKPHGSSYKMIGGIGTPHGKSSMSFQPVRPRLITKDVLAAVGDSFFRKCKKNKYGSSLCFMEVGTVTSSDAIPLGTALDVPPVAAVGPKPVVKPETKLEGAEPVPACPGRTLASVLEQIAALPKTPATQYITSPRFKGTTLSFSAEDITPEGATLLRSVFALGGDAVGRVTNVSISIISPEAGYEDSLPLIADILACGSATSLELTTMRAAPELLTDHLYHALGAGLASPTCTLSQLSLSCVGMSVRGTEVLACGIAASKHLTHVKFHNCAFPAQQGVGTLARACLPNKQGKPVRHLHLARGGLRDIEMEELTLALLVCEEGKQDLQVLDISEDRLADSKIREAGAQALATWLRHPNCRLQELRVQKCNWGAKVMPVLIQAIGQQHQGSGTLTSVDMGIGKCGAKNALALVQAVESNDRLKTVVPPGDVPAGLMERIAALTQARA